MNKKEVIIEYGQNENLTQVEFNCEKKNEFYIGRKQDADIEISKSDVSREQSMIYYEKGNWYIKDGGKEKASGSGTWLFLDKKYEINNDMIFMVGSSTIKLEYILPGKETKNKEENKVQNKDEIKKEINDAKKNENKDNKKEINDIQKPKVSEETKNEK